MRSVARVDSRLRREGIGRLVVVAVRPLACAGREVGGRRCGKGREAWEAEGEGW